LTGSESGLTLIELLIAIAIIGALGAVVVMAIFGLLTSSRQANDAETVVSQLRAAEHWMTRDALTSQIVTPDAVDPTGFPLVLSWTSFDGTAHMVTYSLPNSQTAGLRQLQRVAEVGGIPETLILADYLDPAVARCTYVARTLTVTLGATYGDAAEVRTFEAKPRSDAPPEP